MILILHLISSSALIILFWEKHKTYGGVFRVTGHSAKKIYMNWYTALRIKETESREEGTVKEVCRTQEMRQSEGAGRDVQQIRASERRTK